jgi:hypothetical protein
MTGSPNQWGGVELSPRQEGGQAPKLRTPEGCAYGGRLLGIDLTSYAAPTFSLRRAFAFRTLMADALRVFLR